MKQAARTAPIAGLNLWRAGANAATLAVLALGLAAAAVPSNIAAVLGLLAVATAVDGLDGWLARRAGGPRQSGAVLDLIADLAAFGLVPAAVVITRNPQAGPLLWLGLGIYLCGALARLLRSVRLYARRPPAGWVGMPMPACGWLLLSVSLNLSQAALVAAAAAGIAALAVSRRHYPSPAWMWRNTRGLALGVIAAGAAAAMLAWQAGLLIVGLAYALYPLLRRIGHGVPPA
jgi:CDP-diacylglycerol---serine O-phosphatidyltransferase